MIDPALGDSRIHNADGLVEIAFRYGDMGHKFKIKGKGIVRRWLVRPIGHKVVDRVDTAQFR
jgi:hypothetical protein